MDLLAGTHPARIVLEALCVYLATNGVLDIEETLTTRLRSKCMLHLAGRLWSIPRA